MNVQIFLILGIFSFILELWGVKSEASTYMFSLKNVEGMFSNVNSKISRYLTSSEMEGDSTMIYGNSSYLKYYYVNINVGNPPQKQALIIDTGSQMTAVPCQPYCTQCGNHINSYYDMRNSNASELLDCENKYCKWRCDSDKKCTYSMSYGEGSSLSGFMIQDLVVFSDSYRQLPPTKVPLGCTTRENKLFFTQEVDGIMGLGPGNSTFLYSMYEAGGIASPVFSICMAPNDGYFSIGGVNTTLHNEEISYIPFYDRNFYRVKLKDIKLNNDDIDISDAEYYTIIDSGTTISYLPSFLFKQVEKLVNIYCSQIDKCLGDMYTANLGICFKVKESVSENIFMESLPDLTFIFENSVKYVWRPQNYLYNYTAEDNKLNYCIGLTSWNSNEILLGTTWMHNHDIIFDNVNKQIGLVSSGCNGFPINFIDNPKNETVNPPSSSQPVTPEPSPVCNPDYDFYVTIILMLSIFIVMLILILVLAFFRIRRGQSFLWMKLQNEESGENRNISNSNNKIEMNKNNLKELKTKDDFNQI